MGMYDYINGNQIKCFYTPLFYVCDILEDNYINHSGGSLTGFNTGCKVPFKTMYYNYSKDFIIYDYRADNFVHIIKDGMVYETILLDKLSDEYISYICIDYFGNKLNIKTKDDMFVIKNEFKDLFENKRKISRKIKENPSMRKEYIKEMKLLNKEFNNKWIIVEFKDEKYFGELISNYIWFKENAKTTEEIKDFNLCKSLIINLLNKNENIISSYNNWSKYKYAKEVDMILHDLKTT